MRLKPLGGRSEPRRDLLGQLVHLLADDSAEEPEGEPKCRQEQHHHQRQGRRVPHARCARQGSSHAPERDRHQHRGEQEEDEVR